MGDPVSQGMFAGAGLFGAKKAVDRMMPTIPKMPKLPAPVEAVDVQGQSNYTKARLRSKKGRASTILASKPTGKKTVLG